MILVALIALAARAAAAPPAEDARAEAIRFANALTGVDPDDDDEREDDEEDNEEDNEDQDQDPDDNDTDAVRDDDDNDDRVDGSVAEGDDVRRAIEESGDGQDDRDPAIAGWTTGALPALDGGTAASSVAGDDVSFSAASAGAPETYESWMRHQRPSRWGRLDLGVQWRRRWSEPMQAMSRRYDEVLLVATWRR